jgi:hypothetical protein
LQGDNTLKVRSHQARDHDPNEMSVMGVLSKVPSPHQGSEIAPHKPRATMPRLPVIQAGEEARGEPSGAIRYGACTTAELNSNHLEIVGRNVGRDPALPRALASREAHVQIDCDRKLGAEMRLKIRRTRCSMSITCSDAVELACCMSNQQPGHVSGVATQRANSVYEQGCDCNLTFAGLHVSWPYNEDWPSSCRCSRES